jgi:hypothetical protein
MKYIVFNILSKRYNLEQLWNLAENSSGKFLDAFLQITVGSRRFILLNKAKVSPSRHLRKIAADELPIKDIEFAKKDPILSVRKSYVNRIGMANTYEDFIMDKSLNLSVYAMHKISKEYIDNFDNLQKICKQAEKFLKIKKHSKYRLHFPFLQIISSCKKEYLPYLITIAEDVGLQDIYEKRLNSDNPISSNNILW